MDNLKWQLLKGNCVEVMKTIPDGKVDLVLTSPPYEEMRKYENSFNLFGDEYVDFIIDVGREIKRVLREGGVFVLNIQSQVDKKTKERSLSVHKIIIKMVEELGFSYIEPYIWAKTASQPYKSNLRAYNAFEYCLWFSKGTKNMTFNVDNIRRPYSEVTLKRYEYTVNPNFGQIDETGKRNYAKDESTKKRKKLEPHPNGALPSNVISLPPCTGMNKKHPAQMQPLLAEFFIKAASNKGDIVLDPFAGSGTTLKEGLKYGANVIGIELSDTYIKDAYDDLINENNLLNHSINDIIVESKFNYIQE